MASVFTYDPDPPRVSSPWSTSGTTAEGSDDPPAAKSHLQPTLNLRYTLLADCGVTKLEAEPPEGPTEYKLHLLLRPRRRFSASSTSHFVSGSHHSKPSQPFQPDGIGEAISRKASPMPAPSKNSRQTRLQQLTTQLLWRLQQSSPYHSSSTNDLILPVLPEATPKLGAPTRPARLLPGLEESRGALYEIGVSDDGSFVGLTHDEMEESLTNLRAMAGSLGCDVELLRAVVVGNCEWVEEPQNRVHREKLWVAEALILPILDTRTNTSGTNGPSDLLADVSAASPSQSNARALPVACIESQTAQLRVSLTGATTSGKSSLLGTLSTATFDNGRGKSRLSLLKHRHEIASGITSSLSQELLGYRDNVPSESNDGFMTEVINYASGNVSSWNDIHASAEAGRLVFVSDSAGHPRYRRTTVRGLVSWAPHWTLCCISSTGGQDSDRTDAATTAEGSTVFISDLDRQNAHLKLCLKLQLPLVVVITKLDLASKAGLKQTLATVLSTLKWAGRRPVMLSTGPNARNQEPNLQFIPTKDEAEVDRLLSSVPSENLRHMVPIVLTSVVNGTGISTVHALLRRLPSPGPTRTVSEGLYERLAHHPRSLFHIDEVFALSSSQVTHLQDITGNIVSTGSIVCGHLAYGELAIGDEILLGPLAIERECEESYSRTVQQGPFSTPIENGPETLRSAIEQRSHSYSSLTYPPLPHADDSAHLEAQSEWQRVRIVSLRNLRLPVHKLFEGQVGTIGIVPVARGPTTSTPPPPEHPTLNQKVRRGMVLANLGTPDGLAPRLSTCSGFVATFDECDVASLPAGSLVIVYIASIRASARITKVAAAYNNARPETHDTNTEIEVFSFDDNDDDDTASSSIRPGRYEVEFQFVACREWIEVGVLALVMPAGGHGTFVVKGGGGLEGVVGRVSRCLR